MRVHQKESEHGNTSSGGVHAAVGQPPQAEAKQSVGAPSRFAHDSFTMSLVHLAGHIVGSGLLFCILILVEWSIAVFLHFLDEKHPFSAELKELFHQIEMGIAYLDVFLAGLVVLAGAVRFIQKVFSGSRSKSE